MNQEGKIILDRWIKYTEIPEIKGKSVFGEISYGILMTTQPEECVFFGETQDSYIGYFLNEHLNFRIVKFLKVNVTLVL